MTNREKLLNYIKDHSYKHSDEPIYKLSSGKTSNHYFNLKETTYSAPGQYLIGNVVYDKILELNLKPDAIGGLVIGADPIASAVAYTSYLKNNPIDAVAIRDKRKEHGMQLQIEGSVNEGDSIVIVEDVVTTGGSTIKAIDIAMGHKLNIIAVIALVDREENNGKQNIEAKGVTVYPIFTIQDF